MSPLWTDLVAPRVLLSALVLLLLVPLYFVRRRYQQQGVGGLPWIALGLLAALWVPKGWRDVLVAGACALLLLVGANSIVGMVIAGIAGYAVARVVPGGGSVLVLVGLTIAGIFMVRSAVSHLRALARTRRLEPGSHPSGPVQLGGRVEAARQVPLPGQPEGGEETSRPASVVAWQASCNGQLRYSRGELRIVGEHGVARVELVGAKLELERSQSLTGKTAQRLARELGLDFKKEDTITLGWLEPGAEGYVRGIPEWHADPQGGGYRNSSLVPLFRTPRPAAPAQTTETEGAASTSDEVPARDEGFERLDHVEFDLRRVYFADRSLEVLQQGARWTLWAWAVWGTVCAAVAVTQLLGY